MNKLSISSVAPTLKEQSKAARLDELLPEIEVALAAGHGHKTIFEDIIKSAGLDLTFGYYKNIIHRLRWRDGASANPGIAKATPRPENSVPKMAGLVVKKGPSNTTKISQQVQTMLHGSDDNFFS